MLPDFPKIKGKFIEIINQYLQNLVRQEPLLSQIREERHFEGDRISSKTINGELEQSSYKKMCGKISIKREDVIAKGPTAIIENIQNIAEEIKAQKAKFLLDKINEITEKSGNVVSGEGGPFTFELFIKTLEKIWIDFDEQGNPFMPTVVVHPQIGAKIKEKLPEWEANPEYKRRFEDIIERKRKEWNDRESNRKLVD